MELTLFWSAFCTAFKNGTGDLLFTMYGNWGVGSAADFVWNMRRGGSAETTFRGAFFLGGFFFRGGKAGGSRFSKIQGQG